MASIERRASNFTRFDDSDAVDATALAVGYGATALAGLFTTGLFVALACGWIDDDE